MHLDPLPFANFVPRYIPPNSPDQWFGHLAFAYDLVCDLHPSLLVEVETQVGDSYFALCQAVFERTLHCLCYGVQTPGRHVDLETYNSGPYASFSYLLENEAALDRFRDGSIDLLHMRDWERKTFLQWLEKVKPGGVILLNGIAERWGSWEEASLDFEERFAFHHGTGLGVLRKKGGDSLASAFLQKLFGGARELREYIERHYVIYRAYIEHILCKTGANEALSASVNELRTELLAGRHEKIILEAELTQAQFDRSELQRQVASLRASLADFQVASDLKEQQHAEKERQVREEVERLTASLRSERDVIHSLMHSLSWQVTAPLRSLVAALRSRKRGG